ncbi:hypothetical protein QYM36_004304, partial [Artemia franciscana]
EKSHLTPAPAPPDIPSSETPQLNSDHPRTGCPHIADAALIAEAHGLVTDMLLESSQLPSHIISGLK